MICKSNDFNRKQKKKYTILLIMLNKIVIQEPNAREFEYVCGD